VAPKNTCPPENRFFVETRIDVVPSKEYSSLSPIVPLPHGCTVICWSTILREGAYRTVSAAANPTAPNAIIKVEIVFIQVSEPNALSIQSPVGAHSLYCCCATR